MFYKNDLAKRNIADVVSPTLILKQETHHSVFVFGFLILSFVVKIIKYFVKFS
jgi:hypothetical protein